MYCLGNHMKEISDEQQTKKWKEKANHMVNQNFARCTFGVQDKKVGGRRCRHKTEDHSSFPRQPQCVNLFKKTPIVRLYYCILLRLKSNLSIEAKFSLTWFPICHLNIPQNRSTFPLCCRIHLVAYCAKVLKDTLTISIKVK